MRAWLLGFDKPKKNAYETAGYELGKDMSNLIEVESSLTKTTEYDDLYKLKGYAEAIEYKPIRDKVLPRIQTKLDAVGEELRKLTEERKSQRLEEERQAAEIAREEMRIAKEITRLQAEKEKYETIKVESDDKRKRENAKRNLDKINERLRSMT